MFALIDANSFYCACEQAFNPRLRDKPLVVLSNNDGCVISRTPEAKALGIGMGEPWHLVSRQPAFGSTAWRSSNYALYGDMSRRVHQVLAERVAQVEPYSIDELFLDYSGLAGDLAAFSQDLRQAVRQIAKIPSCIGIGPTKTLAKLANKLAKNERGGLGVVDLSSAVERTKLFRDLPLDQVWGLGSRSVAKLAHRGVTTVAEFVALPEGQTRALLTVTGLRVRAELQGLPCFPLTLHPPSPRSLAVTRSFGRPVTAWSEMREAIAAYVTRAAEKLRRREVLARALQVFLHTSRFTGDPPYWGQATGTIKATCDTLALLATALRLAKGVWREGYRYAKAGVLLLDLYRPQDLPVGDLFASRDPEKSRALMAALDRINKRFGPDTVRPALVPPAPAWAMRRARLSPAYTTRLADVLRARG